MFLFDSLKKHRKSLVFCFQGDQKGTLGRKGLKREDQSAIGCTRAEGESYSKHQQ